MAAAATAQGGETRFAQAYAELSADGSIQFALPPYEAPKPPAWAEPIAEFLRALGPYMVYFFWGSLIAGGLVILFLVLREARGVAWRLPWRSKPKEAESPPSWAPDAETARVLLSEADALAAQGEFEAAVHLLLRRSVADITERLPGFLKPSLTARDIAAADRMPDRARTAFGAIARVVEAALFARQPVGAAGWEAAREAYGRFAFRDAWA